VEMGCKMGFSAPKAPRFFWDMGCKMEMGCKIGFSAPKAPRFFWDMGCKMDIRRRRCRDWDFGTFKCYQRIFRRTQFLNSSYSSVLTR